jgi:hypothetical protein
MRNSMFGLLPVLQVRLLLSKYSAFPAASLQLRDSSEVGKLRKTAESRAECDKSNIIKNNLDKQANKNFEHFPNCIFQG